MEHVILRVVRNIKAVLILLHVLVNIFYLDMIAETISIREQLSLVRSPAPWAPGLVIILRLDILTVELVQ